MVEDSEKETLASEGRLRTVPMFRCVYVAQPMTEACQSSQS